MVPNRMETVVMTTTTLTLARVIITNYDNNRTICGDRRAVSAPFKVRMSHLLASLYATEVI